MWISARTALTLAAAALLLVVVAVAAPLLPGPRLPPLPAARHARKADKFGPATLALDSPERARTQGMRRSGQAPAGAARWAGQVGVGASAAPTPATVDRLRALLNDARTVADPRAERAEPTWVVRFVRDDHRVDVMGDPAKDRVVVVEDERLVGAYSVEGLRREFLEVARELSRERL